MKEKVIVSLSSDSSAEDVRHFFATIATVQKLGIRFEARYRETDAYIRIIEVVAVA